MHKRLILFFFGTWGVAGLLIVIVFFTASVPVKAEWWIKNREFVLDHIAGNKKGPKIVTCSGSNSLLGVDGDVISEYSDYDFMTIGTFGGIASFDYYSYLLNKYLQEGDIVLLPLEFHYYSRSRVSAFEVKQVAAWNKKMFWELPLLRQLEYLKQVSPRMYFNTGWLNLHPRKFLTRNEVVATIEKEWRRSYSDQSSITKPAGYVFETTDRYGAFLPHGTTEDLKAAAREGFPYLSESQVSNFFLENYRNLVRLIESKGAHAFLTWPVSIRNQQFDLTAETSALEACNLKRSLLGNGITLYGSPAYFQYSVRFFWDTQYHLNRSGAVVRSAFLLKLVNDIKSRRISQVCSVEGITDQARAVKSLLNRAAGMSERQLIETILAM